MNLLIKALQARYDSEVKAASANIDVYLTHPVGIGEHPDIVSAVDSEVRKLAEAEDKLSTLLDYYSD